MVKTETIASRRDLAKHVSRIVGAIRSQYAASLDGVGLHGLRTTHRTWALNADVNEALIDVQLGHAKGKHGVGRKHYTDRWTIDAVKSARAVRQALDAAERERAETHRARA